MRKLSFITFILLAFLFFGYSITLAYEKEIKTLSSSITDNISKVGKKTVAVVDFTDLQGNVTELGRFLAEEISVDLTTSAQNFEVIDRNHLKSILTEHKLSISGLVDPKTVKKLGQIAGVDAIVTGTVTPFGDSIRVTCKVIATDTARVIGAAKCDIAKTKAIEELLSKGIDTGTQPVSSETSAMTSAAKAQQKVEAGGFIFELQRCKLSGQTVACYFLITNKENDKELDFGFQGRIFDVSGNEYKATNLQLGNHNNGGWDKVRNLLVSGIPAKASIEFEKVSEQIDRIALLEFNCYSGKDFKIQFRNILLSR